jgi:hypothetical protein
MIDLYDDRFACFLLTLVRSPIRTAGGDTMHIASVTTEFVNHYSN